MDLNWRDVKELLAIMGLCFGAALVFLVVVASLSAATGAYQCSNYSQITGRQTNYEILAGCYILVADDWQLWDEYKARATASEGLK